MFNNNNPNVNLQPGLNNQANYNFSMSQNNTNNNFNFINNFPSQNISFPNNQQRPIDSNCNNLKVNFNNSNVNNANTNFASQNIDLYNFNFNQKPPKKDNSTYEFNFG